MLPDSTPPNGGVISLIEHGSNVCRGSLWGCEDLWYLSRYDGLLYLRLNLLGAYAPYSNEDEPNFVG